MRDGDLAVTCLDTSHLFSPDIVSIGNIRIAASLSELLTFLAPEVETLFPKKSLAYQVYLSSIHVGGIMHCMLTEFVTKKVMSARFKKLADGTYFGEIPSVRGVWANGKNMSTCRTELREVLEEWLVLQLHSGAHVPGIRIASPHGVYGKYIAA